MISYAQRCVPDVTLISVVDGAGIQLGSVVPFVIGVLIVAVQYPAVGKGRAHVKGVVDGGSHTGLNLEDLKVVPDQLGQDIGIGSIQAPGNIPVQVVNAVPRVHF